MSTIKSSDEHLTINADGSGKEVKIQRDGTEVLATTSSGVDISGSVSDTDGNVRSGRKNLIINGGMDVAQRGTSNTNVTTGGYISMDRYETDISSAGTWTISQDSDAPSGFGSSFKFLCTTADASISGSDRISFRHKIEGQNLQQLKKGTSDAESVTVSFWVKSNKTGTYIVEIYDYDNSRFISKSYTISVADTWEQKSITFAGDTTGALDNDNDKSLHLHFWLGVGSGFSSGTLQTSWGGAGNTNRAVGQVNLADSTSNYLNITGVQLELGSVATDFEQRSYGEELALCQRYYTVAPYYTEASKVNSVFGHAKTNSRYTWVVTQFPVQMRIVPTVNLISGAGGNGSTTTDGKARYVETYGGAGGSDLVPYSLGPSHKDSFCIKTYNEHDSGAWYGIQAGYTADAEL